MVALVCVLFSKFWLTSFEISSFLIPTGYSVLVSTEVWSYPGLSADSPRCRRLPLPQLSYQCPVSLHILISKNLDSPHPLRILHLSTRTSAPCPPPLLMLVLLDSWPNTGKPCGASTLHLTSLSTSTVLTRWSHIVHGAELSASWRGFQLTCTSRNWGTGPDILDPLQTHVAHSILGLYHLPKPQSPITSFDGGQS